MAAHFRFVRDHHKQIRRVAFATDSALGMVAENLASVFVAAEIKLCPSMSYHSPLRKLSQCVNGEVAITTNG